MTAGETVAQSVAEAAKDSAFAHNPNDLSIGYSSNSDDEEDLDDDEDSEDDSSQTPIWIALNFIVRFNTF
jgi:hypothetical protein